MTDTPFDAVVDKALNALTELHGLQALRKGSATYFMQSARALTKRDASEYPQLLDIVTKANGAVAYAVRDLSKFFASNTCPSFPVGPKLDQCWRMQTGHIASLEVEMLSLGLTQGDVVYLAVLRASIAYEAGFGDIQDWIEHQNRIAVLRQKMIEFDQMMRKTVSGDDLIYVRPERIPKVENADEKLARIVRNRGDAHAAANERQRELETERQHEEYAARKNPELRLAGPWLKRAPSISITAQDWPYQFLRSVLRADALFAKYRAEAVADGAADREAGDPKAKPSVRKVKAKPQEPLSRAQKAAKIGRVLPKFDQSHHGRKEKKAEART